MSSLRSALLPWALGSLFFCYAFLHRVSPSAMVGELMRDFGVGAAVLGNLAAFYLYAYASLQLAVGVLMDRFGARLLVSIFAALAGLGGLLFAATPIIELAYVGRLMIGIGAAFSWVGCLTITAALLPPERFTQMAGLSQMIGMAGAVFGQLPVALAVDAVGWRGTLAGLGIAGLVLGAALWLGVPPRATSAATGPGMLRGLGQVLRRAQTWYCALFGLAMTAPLIAYAGLWAVPAFMVRYGMERPEAAATATLMFIGWGLGCPAIGWLSDRLGRRRLLMLACSAVAAAALAAVVLLPVLPRPVLWALMLLHGAAASAMIIAFGVARDACPPGTGSSAMGWVNTAVVGGAAMLQPLIGWLLDRAWDGTVRDGVRIYTPAAYDSALLPLPLVCSLAVVAALLVRDPRR